MIPGQLVLEGFVDKGFDVWTQLWRNQGKINASLASVIRWKVWVIRVERRPWIRKI